MAITTITPPIFEPMTCGKGLWVDQFNANLTSVTAMLGSLNTFGTQLESERTGFISDKTQAISDIDTLKNQAVAAKDEAVSAKDAAETAAGTAANQAAQQAADTVIAAALGTEVNLEPGGNYTFPTTMTPGEKISINPTGDMEGNPAVINYNGHKFMGQAITSDSYDMNVGVQFVYISANYGLGAN